MIYTTKRCKVCRAHLDRHEFHDTSKHNGGTRVVSTHPLLFVALLVVVKQLFECFGYISSVLRFAWCVSARVPSLCSLPHNYNLLATVCAWVTCPCAAHTARRELLTSCTCGIGWSVSYAHAFVVCGRRPARLTAGSGNRGHHENASNEKANGKPRTGARWRSSH